MAMAMPLAISAQKRKNRLMERKILKREDRSIRVKINIKSRIPMMLNNFTLIFMDRLIFKYKSNYAFSIRERAGAFHSGKKPAGAYPGGYRTFFNT
jgi:hypothetical protein